MGRGMGIQINIFLPTTYKPRVFEWQDRGDGSQLLASGIGVILWPFGFSIGLLYQEESEEDTI
jgi:hypothetical protein